jgi:hypothetical protein
MVANINSSLPIQIPSPRYLIIDPTISRAQAQVRADGRADRAFGIKSLLGRSEASARPCNSAWRRSGACACGCNCATTAP